MRKWSLVSCLNKGPGQPVGLCSVNRTISICQHALTVSSAFVREQLRPYCMNVQSDWAFIVCVRDKGPMRPRLDCIYI